MRKVRETVTRLATFRRAHLAWRCDIQVKISAMATDIAKLQDRVSSHRDIFLDEPIQQIPLVGLTSHDPFSKKRVFLTSPQKFIPSVVCNLHCRRCSNTTPLICVRENQCRAMGQVEYFSSLQSIILKSITLPGFVIDVR